MRWFAYPNANWLKVFNPEASTKLQFRYRGQKNVFQKNDLESRFYHLGMMWDYASTDLFNFALDFYRSSEDRLPSLPIETYVLAGTKDGFWDDSSQANIQETVGRYAADARFFFKERSHLWVVTPENLAELLFS